MAKRTKKQDVNTSGSIPVAAPKTNIAADALPEQIVKTETTQTIRDNRPKSRPYSGKRKNVYYNNSRYNYVRPADEPVAQPAAETPPIAVEPFAPTTAVENISIDQTKPVEKLNETTEKPAVQKAKGRKPQNKIKKTAEIAEVVIPKTEISKSRKNVKKKATTPDMPAKSIEATIEEVVTEIPIIVPPAETVKKTRKKAVKKSKETKPEADSIVKPEAEIIKPVTETVALQPVETAETLKIDIPAEAVIKTDEIKTSTEVESEKIEKPFTVEVKKEQPYKSQKQSKSGYKSRYTYIKAKDPEPEQEKLKDSANVIIAPAEPVKNEEPIIVEKPKEEDTPPVITVSSQDPKKNVKNNKKKDFQKKYPEKKVDDLKKDKSSIPNETIKIDKNKKAPKGIKPQLEQKRQSADLPEKSKSKESNLEQSEEIPPVRRNEQARQNIKKQTQKPQRFFAKPEEISQDLLLQPSIMSEPFFNRIFSEIEKFIDREAFFDSDTGVVAAVSGGVDSVVMLDALAHLARKKNFKLAIAHFNHNLRGEDSFEDEKFVNNLAKSYNIPYYTASSKVADYAEKTSMSIENAARQLRYRFFEKTARTIKANYVITAHTADDSVETFFINLFRGSGLTGLSSIPVKRRLIKDVSIIRPLINFKKSELIDYAKRRTLGWREDASNAQLNYTRNKIRHELIPLIEKEFSPALVSIINRTSKLICGADDFVSSHISNILEALITDKLNDRFSVKLPLLMTHSEFIQGEILQSAISKNFQMQPLAMNIIDRLLNLHNNPVGAICEIAQNYIAVRDRDTIIFARKPLALNCNEVIKKTGVFEVGGYKLTLEESGMNDVHFTGNGNEEFFDFDLLPKALYLRSWQPGDTFKPLGSGGSTKIGDFLTNHKVSIIDRQNVLVLATKSEIIWVCGFRISEKFKISKTTNKVIKAVFEKIEQANQK